MAHDALECWQVDAGGKCFTGESPPQVMTTNSWNTGGPCAGPQGFMKSGRCHVPRLQLSPTVDRLKQWPGMLSSDFHEVLHRVKCPVG
jgi:hypothetical protein